MAQNRKNGNRQINATFLIKRLKEFGPLPLTIAVFIVVVSIIQPRFTSWSNLQNVFRQVSFLSFVALGEMLPLLVEGFDLSPGGVVGVVSVISSLVIKEYGIITGILAGVGIGTLFGAVNGFFITCRYKLNPFVVTLGVMYAGQGISLYITNGVPVYGMPNEFGFLGAGSLGPFPVSILFSGFCFVVFHFLLTYTYFGRVIYAIGGNEVAAIQSGINARLYRFLAYTLCGLMAGIGSVILTSRVLSGEPTMGYHSALEGIAAVLIGGVSLSGGKGRVINVVFGVALFALLSNCLNLLGISSYIQTITIGAVIIMAVLFDKYRQTITNIM